MLDSINEVKNIIRIFLIGMSAMSVLILSFVLVFWIRGRINEIGILISIGISRRNVFAQLISEILIIGGSSLIIASIAGRFLSNGLGKMLVSISSSDNGSVGIGNWLNMSIGGGEYMIFIIMAAAIVILSVLIAYLPIIVQKPKQILSRMS